MNKNVLIVEDEALVALLLKSFIERNGHTVVDSVMSGEEAMEIAKTDDIDIILMDVNLAGILNGIETIKKIKQFKEVLFAYMTAYTDDENILKMKQTEPVKIISKPIRIDEVLELLNCESLGDSINS